MSRNPFPLFPIPLYRNVAHDPRYAAFLRKMNLPE
jgi:hypothetical protein